MRDWVRDLSASGLSPGTVRQAHRVLSLILAEAVKDGRLSRNPASGVQLPRAIRSDPRFLTAVEVARLVEAAHPNGLSVAILAFCGLRLGELAALRVRRVNLLRRRLVVAEVSPKWPAAQSGHYPRPTAPGRCRSCRHWRWGSRRCAREWGPRIYSSPLPRGGALRLGNWRRRVFDPACRAARLVDVTPHDLRHTAASLAIASGANVKAVQQMLGHASAAMTLGWLRGSVRRRSRRRGAGSRRACAPFAPLGGPRRCRPERGERDRQCLNCGNVWWAPSGSNRRPAD